MINFRIETQGTDTYIVCEIPEGAQVDTVGLGMLCNNKIRGLAPLSTVALDNKEYLRYNISSHITLDKLFYNKTDKKRFLAVLKNILTTIRDMQDYMLEPSFLLLAQNQIYVNVGSLQTAMLYYPILETGKEFNLRNFLRELIMTMEFDSSEDSSYVTKLINYLNKSAEISVEALQEYINTLVNDTSSKMSSSQYNMNPGMTEAQGIGYGQMQPQQGYGMNQYYDQNSANTSPLNPNMQAMSGMMSPNQPSMPNGGMQMPPNNGMQVPPNGGMQVPPNANGNAAPTTEPPKKKGLFGGMKTKEKKPVEKKEKPKKEKKGKAGNQKIEAPAGIVIPGMENTKNSSLPMPPQAPGAAMKAPANQQAPMTPPPMQQAPMTPPPMQQAPMTPPPMQQAPMTPPPMQQAPMTPPPMQQAPMTPPPMQQAPMTPPPMQQAPMTPPPMQRVPMTPPPMQQAPMTPPAYSQPVPMGPDFGHTVILEEDDYSKGTMILMDDFEPTAGRRKAYLIRKKTNERIEINKDVFRIGKEKDFVDYWVSNNSAVSRSHADIIYQDGNYYIMDNNSLNHTYVNDQQIASQQMVKLEEFSRIKLANEYFEFQL